MLVELRRITEIRPYANNPRTNDQAVAAVATSIRTFGFRQPIVVDEDGVIIAGHTRYKAALRLGLEVVPVHVAVGMSPEQVAAYRLADNQTATKAEWDADKLALELAALQGTDLDVSVTGFSSDELARLMEPVAADGHTEPDSVPELPDAPITQPGDLWVLGAHRVLCGDAGRPADV